jgi:hypothetical protein
MSEFDNRVAYYRRQDAALPAGCNRSRPPAGGTAGGAERKVPHPACLRGSTLDPRPPPLQPVHNRAPLNADGVRPVAQRVQLAGGDLVGDHIARDAEQMR